MFLFQHQNQQWQSSKDHLLLDKHIPNLCGTGLESTQAAAEIATAVHCI
jgi:hypothetical protein